MAKWKEPTCLKVTTDYADLCAQGEAAMEGTTEGHWIVEGETLFGKDDGFTVDLFDLTPYETNERHEADAAFIAWAHNNVPALLAAIRDLEARLEAARADAKEAEAYVEEVEKDREELRKRANEKIISLEKDCAAQAAQLEAMRGALEPFALASIEGVVKPATGHVTLTMPAEYFHRAAALTTKEQTDG